MIPVDILLTGVIVAAAVTWAGRSLWRWLRRRSSNAAATPSCGGQPGTCGHCPVEKTDPAALLQDPTTCGESGPEES